MADVLSAAVPQEQLLYPRLEGMSTALIGFCAAFHGQQDCVWVAEAGMDAVCVDTDPVRLSEMEAMYPEGWRFVCRDMFAYAQEQHEQGAVFDLVSLDPFTNLFDRCAAHAGLWCSLAARMVILGIGRDTRLDVPEGWRLAGLIRRSDFAGGTFWATLEPTC